MIQHGLKPVIAVFADCGAEQGSGYLQLVKMASRALSDKKVTIACSAIDSQMEWLADQFSGTVVAFSPAASRSEHADVYRLDTSWADMVIYTGAEESHVEQVLASSNAVLMVCDKGEIWDIIMAASRRSLPVGVITGQGQSDLREQAKKAFPAGIVTDSILASIDVKGLMVRLQQLI